MDNLIVLDPEKYKSVVYDVTSDFTISGQYKWRVGELQFESLMRMLDNLVSPQTQRFVHLTQTSWQEKNTHEFMIRSQAH